jgi:hypothetical protein
MIFSQLFREALAGGRYSEADTLLRRHAAGLRDPVEFPALLELISWAGLAVRAARAHDALELAAVERKLRYLGQKTPEVSCDVCG